MANVIQQRLAAVGIAASVETDRQASRLLRRPLLAIVSSHLGTSASRHACVCRYVAKSLLDARQRDHVLLVAAGSAIEPWAIRAADLFGVTLLRIATRKDECQRHQSDCGSRVATLTIEANANRDELVISLADRVDCVWVRPKGKIDRALRKRLQRRSWTSTRIAIQAPFTEKPSHRVAGELMTLGALGWYCPVPQSRHRRPSRPIHQVRTVPAGWARCADDAGDADSWLVHCTRACEGPWPGQSWRQHRDALFLSEAERMAIEPRTPLESLKRIVRMRRLVASAITTDHRMPAVCFSSLPLQTLLSRRRYRPHLHRWDYEPYGIAIRKSAAIAAGFQPVLYGTTQDRQQLEAEDLYRFQARGNTYDWTEEREWRHRGDVTLDAFDRQDVRVFVADHRDAAELPPQYPMSAVGRLATSHSTR